MRRSEETPLRRHKVLGLIPVVLALALQPQVLLACAACYGQDSGPMARGMNWGIFSLLAVIVCVLIGVAGFFIYLANRTAPSPTEVVPPQLASSKGI
jgi:heme/copper-type cytochrome/quinol oxidase subunit 2